MNARSTAAGLLGLATIALAGACGGELTTQSSDGGVRSSGPTPMAGPATGIGEGSSGASPGTSGSSAGTAGSAGPPGSAPSDDLSEGDAAACSANILAHSPGTALGTCWSCIVNSCLSDVKTCMADCACDEVIAGALSCSDTGEAAMCFLPTLMPGDTAQTAVGQCIVKAQADCPCDLSGGAPNHDASADAAGMDRSAPDAGGGAYSDASPMQRCLDACETLPNQTPASCLTLCTTVHGP